MIDKTARAEAARAHDRADWIREQIDKLYARGDNDLANALTRFSAIDHKFNLLMEYLNAREVEYPEVPAVPAYKKIEKVRK